MLQLLKRLGSIKLIQLRRIQLSPTLKRPRFLTSHQQNPCPLFTSVGYSTENVGMADQGHSLGDELLNTSSTKKGKTMKMVDENNTSITG